MHFQNMQEYQKYLIEYRKEEMKRNKKRQREIKRALRWAKVTFLFFKK